MDVGVRVADTLPPLLLPVAKIEGGREGVKVCVAEPEGVKISEPCADTVPKLLPLGENV